MAVGTPYSLGQLPRTFQGVNASGAFVDVYTINVDGTITFNTAVTLDVVLSAVLSIAEGGTGQTTSVAAFDALSAIGTTIASVAGVTDIGAATGPYVIVSGTEAITGFGTKTAGTMRLVKFSGACSIVHHGTTNILPGGANISCAANDHALFFSLGSGSWICAAYWPTSVGNAELKYLDITTLGTGAASKAVVLDAGDDYTWPATGILTYGVLKDPAGTTLGATAAEINNATDISARMVAAGGTLAVTEALHAGKIIQLDTLAGSVCTLPAASGSGARYEFVTTVLATSNSHIVKVNATPGTDIMVGRATVADAADDTQTTFVTTATSDTITFNRTTTGSVRIGERIQCIDVKAGFWAVDVVCVGTGGEATPFSATVP